MYVYFISFMHGDKFDNDIDSLDHEIASKEDLEAWEKERADSYCNHWSKIAGIKIVYFKLLRQE